MRLPFSQQRSSTPLDHAPNVPFFILFKDNNNIKSTTRTMATTTAIATTTTATVTTTATTTGTTTTTTKTTVRLLQLNPQQYFSDDGSHFNMLETLTFIQAYIQFSLYVNLRIACKFTCNVNSVDNYVYNHVRECFVLNRMFRVGRKIVELILTICIPVISQFEITLQKL